MAVKKKVVVKESSPKEDLSAVKSVSKSVPVKKVSSKKEDKYIEIKLGNNPWMIATVVLSVIVLVLLYLVFSGGVGGTVSGEQAAQGLVDMINSRATDGEQAELVSVQRDGAIYMANVLYAEQEVPVYVTLDGKYAALTVIPLDEEISGLEVQ